MRQRWEDPGVILEIIKKIAYRKGFGSIPGAGCAHAAELLGKNSEYYAMHLS